MRGCAKISYNELLPLGPSAMTTTPLKATALDHVTLSVKNLAESVAFYQTLFGFEIKKEQPDHHSKIIGNEALKLCLYEDPDKVRVGGIAHFGFHIENFSGIVKKCESMGVPMPYGTVDWGDSCSIYIVDPNGYEIELSKVNGGGL